VLSAVELADLADGGEVTMADVLAAETGTGARAVPCVFDAFQLAQQGQSLSSEEVERNAALKKQMGWVKLHPHNIARKVEIVVEHFRQFVWPLLAGKAKANISKGSIVQTAELVLDLGGPFRRVRVGQLLQLDSGSTAFCSSPLSLTRLNWKLLASRKPWKPGEQWRLPDAVQSRQGTQLLIGGDQRPATMECGGRDEAIRWIAVLKEGAAGEYCGISADRQDLKAEGLEETGDILHG
jgi:hypothetical protein